MTGAQFAKQPTLTVSEKAELAELEAVVERGLGVFLDVANALIEIRARRLYRQTHRTFEAYVNERFGLAQRTAYGLIEAHGVAQNVEAAGVVGKLPLKAGLSMSHLRALAPLEPGEQRELAPVVSLMSVVEARRVIKEWRREQRASRPAAEPPPLPAGTFRTIVADPPWPFDGDYGQGLAADRYPTMIIDQICELSVGDLSAPDSHLYLWTPVLRVPDALKVCEAWGFCYVGLLTWIKNGLGMGTWWRVTTEHVVFGVRGKLPTAPNLRNYFEAPRTRHSAKPDEFFELVEKASPGPYVELFARREREGWTAWGNEAGR